MLYMRLRELPPESLTDPCVKVSLYTAPIIQPQWYVYTIGGVTPNFQCANKVGFCLHMLPNHLIALVLCLLHRLNFRATQWANRSFRRWNIGYIADL